MRQLVVSADIEVGASAAEVYRLVSDVPQQHRFTREAVSAVWVEPAGGPQVGARFRGRNRNAVFRWQTTCEVTAADPGQRFAYVVRSMGSAVAEWRYEIEPTDAGCRVTESTRDLRNVLFRWVIGPLGTGVASRSEHNRRNIAATLLRLKKLAERETAQGN